MANDDGVMDRDTGDDGLPHPPTHEASPVVEPTILRHDWPGPSRWRPVLGPGGEELAQVGGENSPDPLPVAPRWRRWSFRRPDPGALLGSAVAAGLLGLATLLVLMLFSFDGGPSVRRDSGTAAALSAPAPVGSSVAEWIAASTRLDAQVRESAERQREAARQKQELARRRERERRRQPPASSSPQTTQVAASSRPAIRPADPWPGVSPAEREFTPGPWNLN
jgi:hypothetical protein